MAASQVEKPREDESATEIRSAVPMASSHARSPVPKVVVAFFAGLRKIFGKAEDEREIVHEPEGVAHTGAWHLRVAVEPDELDGGFVAECPDVPGAMAQGETEEEALENLIDAVNGVVRARMETHLRLLELDPPSETAGRTLDIRF